METNRLNQIKSFLQASEHIATAGQPTGEQLQWVADAGYGTVINLAMEDMDYSLRDERSLVTSLGMDYVHIPVIWESPAEEEFRRFADVMRSRQGERIFVHCAANMRVSAFVALYRILEEGWSRQEAIREMERIWKPNDTWQQFMDRILE